MTPKDKAWVILCEINNAFLTKDDWNNSTPYSKKDLKRKALYVAEICLSELCESNAHDSYIEYWTSVIQILNNLSCERKKEHGEASA